MKSHRRPAPAAATPQGTGSANPTYQSNADIMNSIQPGQVGPGTQRTGPKTPTTTPPPSRGSRNG